MRIEDVDETRAVKGADKAILNTLERLQMGWDREVTYQSRRKERYREAIHYLMHEELAFPCACSRNEVARNGRTGLEGVVYPGTCRNGLPKGKRMRSIRIRTQSGVFSFKDRIAGQQDQDVARSIGDFVIQRADGFTAYQLAVVVDDYDQAITHIVRGADLLASTPRQIYLQRQFGYATPHYAHIPIALDAAGRKISKSDRARSIEHIPPLDALLAALRFLNQDTSNPLPATLSEFWEWAITGWDISRVNNDNVTANTV